MFSVPDIAKVNPHHLPVHHLCWVIYNISFDCISVSDTIGNHGNSEEDKPKTKNVYIVNQPREGAAQRDKVSQSEVAPVVDEAAEDDRIRCAMKEEPREVEDADNDAGLLDHNYTGVQNKGFMNVCMYVWIMYLINEIICIFSSTYSKLIALVLLSPTVTPFKFAAAKVCGS